MNTKQPSALDALTQGDNALITAMIGLATEMGGVKKDIETNAGTTKEVRDLLIKVVENQQEQKQQLSNFSLNFGQLKSEFDANKTILTKFVEKTEAQERRILKLEDETKDFPAQCEKVAKMYIALFGDGEKDSTGLVADFKPIKKSYERAAWLWVVIGSVFAFLITCSGLIIYLFDRFGSSVPNGG